MGNSGETTYKANDKYYDKVLAVLLKRVGHRGTAAILDDLEDVPLSKDLRALVQGLSLAYRHHGVTEK